MSIESRPTAEPSIGELMGQLSTQTSRLVRDEMRLAQKEFQEAAKHAGIGAGLVQCGRSAGVLRVRGPRGPRSDASIDDIQADIERTRQELSETVGTLSEKLDVKKQTQQKAAELREKATPAVPIGVFVAVADADHSATEQVGATVLM